MGAFYTSTEIINGKIAHRYIKNGKAHSEVLDYSPMLFLNSNEKTEYKTVQGVSVKPKTFKDIYAAWKWVKLQKESNTLFYGITDFRHTFIGDRYKSNISYDKNSIRIGIIDIEVYSNNGFPHPETASEEVLTISIKVKDNFFVWGLKDYIPSDNTSYYQFFTEKELLANFISFWQKAAFDIILGWNNIEFDMPYLYNRLLKVFDEDTANRLSFWRKVEKNVNKVTGKPAYKFYGTTILDYLAIYKKFSYTPQESYKLGNVAEEELGTSKLNYEEYGTLTNLYEQNFQKYVDYNILDVELIQKLDNKLFLIDLVLDMAYDCKVNIECVMGQVKLWDMIIFNQHLLPNKIVAPNPPDSKKTSKFIGAYVKEPQVGMHDYVVSFDLNSLYPSIIRMLNISPDTKISEKSLNCSVSASNMFYNKSFQGFLPKILTRMGEQRNEYKKTMNQFEMQLEKAKKTSSDKALLKHLETEVSRYNVKQTVKKVQLNSAYGVLGSQYNRWFSIANAESVTVTGQHIIKSVEKAINKLLSDITGSLNEDFVIAMDTDSIYLRLTSLFKSFEVTEINAFCEEKIQPVLNQVFKKLYKEYSAFEETLKMKRENISQRAIWTGAKTYALLVNDKEGITYSEPKLKVMGLSMVKTSTPKAIKKDLKELVKIMLLTDPSESREYLTKIRKKFLSLKVEQVAFPRGVNIKYSHRLSERGLPIHVRASLVYNNFIKDKKEYFPIVSGDKIRFIYLKEQNPYGEHVFGFVETPPKEANLEEWIDWDMMLDVVFEKSAQILFKACNWSYVDDNYF
jgi:DNA polymerase elongation subunit (family B)